jgi:hypothetical protein
VAERIGRIDEVDSDADGGRTSVLRRVRAVLLLLVMVIVLGLLAAGTLAVVVLGLATFIDQALE